MSATPLMPVFAAKNYRAWPRSPDGGAAMYQPPAVAMLTRYATDAHVAAYSVPAVPRRLDREAPGHPVDGAPLVVAMAFLIIDLDGPDHQAPPAWRSQMAERVERALAEHPGGFSYETRGGGRLVWRRAAPFVITTEFDARTWKLTYWRTLLYLSRRYGLVGDPACADWTRLYRAPHATRDGGGQPEQLPQGGDPKLGTPFAFEPQEVDLELDLAEARRLASAHPPAVGEDGQALRGSPWGAPLRALEALVGVPLDQPPLPLSSSTPRPRRPPLEERQRLWCESALDKLASELARAGRGGRNNAARDAALILGHYAPHLLDPGAIERALLRACEANGLVRDDGQPAALATLRRAISDGMRTPKRPELGAEGQPIGVRTRDWPGFLPTEEPRAPQDDKRPRVLVDFETGKRVRQVEEVLAARDDLNLFVRDGRLVSVEAAEGRHTGWRDEAGTPLARDLSLAALRGLLTDCIRFERVPRVEAHPNVVFGPVPCRVHDDITRGLHQAPAWPRLRHLAGLARAPFLATLDGDLATRRGYDERTGYLLVLPQEGAEVLVPEHPGREQARAALAELKTELLSDFPFAQEQDRSAALAAMLTLCARPALGSDNVPAFLFEANTPSAGKTLLADVVAIVGSGAPAPKHGFKVDDAEMDKTLGGAASEARAVMCFDNLNVPLGGDSLDRAITCGGTYAYRQLGQNKTVHSAWRAVLFFTGNNVRIRGDIGRRVVVCRLESPEEKPSLREGLRHPELRAYAQQHRGRLAGLALTVLRAFCQVPHGARPHVVPLGSFEAWARLVAGALVWLGEANPLDAVADARDELIDPHRAALRVLLARWNELATHPRAREYWGEYGLAARHAVNALYPLGAPAQGDGFDDLREAIEGLTTPSPGKAPSVRHLGTALARVRGQWAGGRQLVGRLDRTGVMVWRVATRTRS